MMDPMMQAIAAAVIAVLVVGALVGCTTSSPDMSRSEAVNITNLAVILEKGNERKVPKR